ncbi:MAG: hypothetical protein ACPF8U_04230 [Flavobacteriales bacterium]
MLTCDHHRLRAMELADVQALHSWENASEDWWMGANGAGCSTPATHRVRHGALWGRSTCMTSSHDSCGLVWLCTSMSQKDVRAMRSRAWHFFVTMLRLIWA